MSNANPNRSTCIYEDRGRGNYRANTFPTNNGRCMCLLFPAHNLPLTGWHSHMRACHALALRSLDLHARCRAAEVIACPYGGTHWLTWDNVAEHLERCHRRHNAPIPVNVDDYAQRYVPNHLLPSHLPPTLITPAELIDPTTQTTMFPYVFLPDPLVHLRPEIIMRFRQLQPAIFRFPVPHSDDATPHH